LNKLERYEFEKLLAVMKTGIQRGDTWATCVNKLADYIHRLEERIVALESKRK
jgi:hypothetical protein